MGLPTQGYEPDECLDFDFACLDFDEWFEAKQDEQVIGQDTGRKLGKNQTWVKKYKTYESIYALFGKHDDASMPSVAEIRQKAADDEAMMIEFWSEEDDDD